MQEKFTSFHNFLRLRKILRSKSEQTEDNQQKSPENIRRSGIFRKKACSQAKNVVEYMCMYLRKDLKI